MHGEFGEVFPAWFPDLNDQDQKQTSLNPYKSLP